MENQNEVSFYIDPKTHEPLFKKTGGNRVITDAELQECFLRFIAQLIEYGDSEPKYDPKQK